MTSNNINNLLIDRRGDTEKSNMTSNYYIKNIKKGLPYTIKLTNLVENNVTPKK